MKSLCIGLFMLVGTLSLSANSNIKTLVETKEATKTSLLILAKVDCIHVSYSCGVSADICNFKGTLKQLLRAVLAQDDAICG